MTDHYIYFRFFATCL